MTVCKHVQKTRKRLRKRRKPTSQQIKKVYFTVDKLNPGSFTKGSSLSECKARRLFRQIYAERRSFVLLSRKTRAKQKSSISFLSREKFSSRWRRRSVFASIESTFVHSQIENSCWRLSDWIHLLSFRKKAFSGIFYDWNLCAVEDWRENFFNISLAFVAHEDFLKYLLIDYSPDLWLSIFEDPGEIPLEMSWKLLSTSFCCSKLCSFRIIRVKVCLCSWNYLFSVLCQTIPLRRVPFQLKLKIPNKKIEKSFSKWRSCTFLWYICWTKFVFVLLEVSGHRLHSQHWVYLFVWSMRLRLHQRFVLISNQVVLNGILAGVQRT